MAFLYWSSICQLNFEPTRPNGLVGPKEPTDLVKIIVKEAMHVGFNHVIDYTLPRDVTASGPSLRILD